MPETLDVQTAIIRVMRSHKLPINQRKLLHLLPASYQSQAKEQIARMLGQNILVRTGLGRRGMPFELLFHPDAIVRYCPCCNRPIYGNETLTI